MPVGEDDTRIENFGFIELNDGTAFRNVQIVFDSGLKISIRYPERPQVVR